MMAGSCRACARLLRGIVRVLQRPNFDALMRRPLRPVATRASPVGCPQLDQSPVRSRGTRALHLRSLEIRSAPTSSAGTGGLAHSAGSMQLSLGSVLGLESAEESAICLLSSYPLMSRCPLSRCSGSPAALSLSPESSSSVSQDCLCVSISSLCMYLDSILTLRNLCVNPCESLEF